MRERSMRERPHKTPARDLLLFKPVEQRCCHKVQRHVLFGHDNHSKRPGERAKRVRVSKRQPGVQLTAVGSVVLVEKVVQSGKQAVWRMQQDDDAALLHAALDAMQVCQKLHRAVVVRKLGPDHDLGVFGVQQVGIKQQRQRRGRRVRRQHHQVATVRIRLQILTHQLRHGCKHERQVVGHLHPD